jgi:hypothetical protein
MRIVESALPPDVKEWLCLSASRYLHLGCALFVGARSYLEKSINPFFMTLMALSILAALENTQPSKFRSSLSDRGFGTFQS